MISILTNNHISIQTRRRVLECYIEPILMYECKAWTISKEVQKKLDCNVIKRNQTTIIHYKRTKNIILGFINNYYYDAFMHKEQQWHPISKVLKEYLLSLSFCNLEHFFFPICNSTGGGWLTMLFWLTPVIGLKVKSPMCLKRISKLYHQALR